MEFFSKLHPIFIHFPIAAFIIYFLLEMISVMLKKYELSLVSFIILCFGVFTSLLAVLTGNQAFSSVKPAINKSNQLHLFSLIEKHEFYATLTLWLFLFILIIKFIFIIKRKVDVKYQLLLILLAFIGCFFVVKAALLGGALVYEHGLGTILFGK